MAKKAVSNDKKTRADDGDTIVVFGAATGVTTRGGGPAQIDVSKLAENVADFLRKIERIIHDAPSTAGGFTMTEFEVTAEISASGKLGILGTGVEVGGKGGLTFKFVKK